MLYLRLDLDDRCITDRCITDRCINDRCITDRCINDTRFGETFFGDRLQNRLFVLLTYSQDLRALLHFFAAFQLCKISLFLVASTLAGSLLNIPKLSLLGKKPIFL